MSDFLWRVSLCVTVCVRQCEPLFPSQGTTVCHEGRAFYDDVTHVTLRSLRLEIHLPDKRCLELDGNHVQDITLAGISTTVHILRQL